MVECSNLDNKLIYLHFDFHLETEGGNNFGQLDTYLESVKDLISGMGFYFNKDNTCSRKQ